MKTVDTSMFIEGGATMTHITTFCIQQYRGIKNASFENLSDVNVFVGENNIGKTSILEAIKLASNPLSKIEYVQVARMRERHLGSRTSLPQSLTWLYPLEGNTKKREEILLNYESSGYQYSIESFMTEQEYETINQEISSNVQLELDDFIIYDGRQTIAEVNIHSKMTKNSQIEERILNFETNQLSITERQKEIFHTIFISAIDHRILALSPNDINELIKSGERQKLIDALQLFDPKITGIELLIENIMDQRQRPTPYIEHKDLGLVPVAMFGDGLRKALVIASRMIRSRNSVLLINEIETGIHTKIIPKFFEWLMDMCKLFNVQIFATTHSLEALDGMLLANQAHLDRLAVYRLEEYDEKLSIRHFSGEKLNKLSNVLG